MAFSFMCHTAVMPVYAELKDRSQSKMQNVSHCAIGFSALIYACTAVMAYLSFRDGTEANILDSFSQYYPQSYSCSMRVALVATFILTVPVLCFPGRQCYCSLFHKFGYVESPRLPLGQHCALTAAIIGLVLVLALYVPGLQAVFGIVGATSSVSLLFLCPGLCYLKIVEGPSSNPDKRQAITLVIAGAIILLVSLGGEFAKFAGVA